MENENSSVSLKLSDFYRKAACVNAERHILDVSTRGNRHLDEAVIVKDVCKQVFSGKLGYHTLDDLIEDISVAYENPDEQAETQSSFVEKLAQRLYRRIKSEYRHDFVVMEKPIKLDLTGYAPVTFAGMDNINVSIDMIVREKGRLEAIIHKKGEPAIGATARSARNVENELPLHLVRLALRRYADTFIKDGEEVELVASYYYMKKKTDKSDQNISMDDYFGKDCPIRSQKEMYTRLSKVESDLDVICKQLLEKYAIGYEKHELCEDTDCKNCNYYCNCYYKPAPVPVAKVEGNKKRARHVLTDEQQSIVNARQGVFCCNAVPGSGKTETAIKQRSVSIILDELDKVVTKYEAGEDVDIKPAASYLTMDSRW